MSSRLRAFVLDCRPLRDAGRAAAQDVLELAVSGYLTMAPDDYAYQSVLLVRTTRPAQRLAPEHKLLLQALFGRVDNYGMGRRLYGEHQLAIAQTLMAVTRELLVREGLVRSLRPRRVYRWLFWSFMGLAALGTTIAFLMYPLWQAAALSGIAIYAAWVVLFLFLGLNQLKYRRIFKTRRGRAEARKPIPRGAPYELLVPDIRIPHSSAPAPAWWAGRRWPGEAGQLAGLVKVLEAALSQRPDPETKTYEPAALTFDDVIDQQLELQVLALDIGGLDLDLTDLGDGGGGGGGGDGDGGGD